MGGYGYVIASSPRFSWSFNVNLSLDVCRFYFNLSDKDYKPKAPYWDDKIPQAFAIIQGQLALAKDIFGHPARQLEDERWQVYEGGDYLVDYKFGVDGHFGEYYDDQFIVKLKGQEIYTYDSGEGKVVDKNIDAFFADLERRIKAGGKLPW